MSLKTGCAEGKGGSLYARIPSSRTGGVVRSNAQCEWNKHGVSGDMKLMM